MSEPNGKCDGTGVVVKYNLTDDSGDSVQICLECNGYGCKPEVQR